MFPRPPELFLPGARQGAATMTIRLMVIDDHDLVRAGLIQYFKMQPDFEVAAEAANCKELLGKLKTTPVDVLLLDMVMPGIDGKNMITLVRVFYPDLKILILSAHDEVQTVMSAIRAGASGFICKTCSPQVLLKAVREVVATGKYIPQNMIERLEYVAVSIQSNNTDAELGSMDGGQAAR